MRKVSTRPLGASDFFFLNFAEKYFDMSKINDESLAMKVPAKKVQDGADLVLKKNEKSDHFT
jgi:hypothetical protein